MIFASRCAAFKLSLKLFALSPPCASTSLSNACIGESRARFGYCFSWRRICAKRSNPLSSALHHQDSDVAPWKIRKHALEHSCTPLCSYPGTKKIYIKRCLASKAASYHGSYKIKGQETQCTRNVGTYWDWSSLAYMSAPGLLLKNLLHSLSTCSLDFLPSERCHR